MFSISDVSVYEPADGLWGYVYVTVALSDITPIGKGLAVAVSTDDGTAKAIDDDYFPAARVLRFSAGSNTVAKTFKVRINGDPLSNEGDEQFTVRLTSAVGASIGDDTATVTIHDDAVVPGIRVSLGSAVTSEGNSGSKHPIRVPITATGGAFTSLVCSISATGTATRNVDFSYSNTTGTVSMSSPRLSTINVVTTPDVEVEGDESVTATLSNCSSDGGPVTITQPNGTLTIVDDD
jgi:hypothetical protein